MIRTFLLLIVMLLGTTIVKSQEPLRLVTVKLQKKSQLQFLQGQDFDIAGVEVLKTGGALVDIVVNPNELWRLEGFGAEFYVSPRSSNPTSQLDDKFKTPEEIVAILNKVHAAYPEITKIIKIGESLEGRPILALRITDHPETNERGEPAMLFNSMHHAREIMSPEVSLDIIEYLVTNYKTDKRVNFWVNNLDIWVVPMLNVDGNAKVWAGNPMWRKNTRDGHGVDLNRNYPFQWGHCNGSSGSRYSDTYRGAAPGSEPETQILMNLVSKVRPVFDISFHSYSNLVIYPLGCKGDRVSDRPLVEGIGAHVGKLIDYTPGYGWELLYSTDGGDIDWMYDRWGVLSYVLEVNSRSEGFHPPFSKRDETVKRNRAGWQFLMDRMFMSGINFDVQGQTGTVYIDVFKAGTKEQLADYEVKKDGTLRIMLTPGVYDLVLRHGDHKQLKRVEVADSLIGLSVKL